MTACREFSDHREELIALFEETRELFQGYEGEEGKDIYNEKRANTGRLNKLKAKAPMFPNFLDGLLKSLKVLKQNGVETSDLEERTEQLADRYTQTYQSVISRAVRE